MNKILYLECNSGISGDMTVGALLDLGADRDVLLKALDSLGVGGYHLHFGRTKKCGIDAYDFHVHLEEEHEGAHGHEHTHEHLHRNLHDINQIIDRVDSNDRVKTMAKRMFEIVAEAESKAHGIPVSEVHFHEVGAIDSIVDIVGTAVCIDNLGLTDIVVSPLSEGFGTVRCQHGIIPVPVPATANIASKYRLKLRFTDNHGEMVTPTGAAIAAALRTREELPSSCRILNTGLGAGKKNFDHANILRAMILEEAGTDEEMWILEANIDDCSGEMLGFAMESLLEAGAADVWNTPVYMKKGRPAYMLSVLCKKEEISRMEDLLFLQTTTIGVRRHSVERTVLDREKRTVSTKWGEAEVKVCTWKDQLFCYPEYESVRNICKKNGADFQTVYAKIRENALKSMDKIPNHLVGETE
ncbi:nickel pincer cofactor biosynthesis protein LarC [Lacrimispora sp. JR3]|uniref:nickel pincer cofactor biosynthesis protein LarC n=1 Tax=Lacrimispora sinapis TaxID=3111456 RepID=UPI0037480125